MGIKNVLFKTAMKPIQALLSYPCKFSTKLLEDVTITYPIATKYGRIYIRANNSITYYRASSFFNKEPETLAWIDQFKENEVFYDIGANIGLYSIYAALKGCKVCAFEPESQNYAELNNNLYKNQLTELVKAINIAFSSENKLDVLNLSSVQPGAALHNIGEPLTYEKISFNPKFIQSICAYRLDDFIEMYKLPVPNYLKIDVDGHEYEIIQGAQQTLQSNDLRSILIELNTDLKCDNELMQSIIGYGFKLNEKYSIELQQENNLSVKNFIFDRV